MPALCFLPLALIGSLASGERGETMALENTRETTLAERINRVENGLVPAICLKGAPLTKKNILDQMRDMKVPAASIAVINEGTVEWAKAYGVLKSGGSKDATTATRFQAGSVSKPVAAFAILSLVNRGILDLDEDVNQRLKSWKVPENEFTKNRKVTLRHLLSHTSGMGVIGFDGYRKGESIPSITETLDGTLPANNPPVRVEFTPFSKMSYSGGGYNVAQQLVEDVTKLPFAIFLDQVLLQPLSMSDSTFHFLDSDNFCNVAHAHPINGVPMDGGWKSYPETAAAGLWTTPADLAKWLIEIERELAAGESLNILSKSLLEDMLTPQVAVHGLGPVVNGQGSDLEISHKGRTDGFTCGFVSFPHLKKGAVVMINAGNEAAFVDDLLRSVACEYQWPSYNVVTKTTIALTDAELDQYVGRYGWCDQPNDIYDLIIFKKDNALFWTIGMASNASRLYPEAEGRFFLLDTGYDVVFNREEGDIASLTIIVQPGFEREFKRFPS